MPVGVLTSIKDHQGGLVYQSGRANQYVSIVHWVGRSAASAPWFVPADSVMAQLDRQRHRCRSCIRSVTPIGADHAPCAPGREREQLPRLNRATFWHPGSRFMS